MGISTLDPLMAIMRKPSASPWRAGGVIWCRVLMIIGCTDPSAMPNNTEQMAMAQVLCMNG